MVIREFQSVVLSYRQNSKSYRDRRDADRTGGFAGGLGGTGGFYFVCGMPMCFSTSTFVDWFVGGLERRTRNAECRAVRTNRRSDLASFDTTAVPKKKI